MRDFRIGLSALAFLAAGAAAAGPASDFEAAFRDMYASYRTALFRTNSGQQEEAAAAMASLSEQLSVLAVTYGPAPPPQYETDPLWGATMADAATLVGAAGQQVRTGDLAAAHATLEGVRDLFGELHARNGIETFSDRMNAYHAVMERFLAMDLSPDHGAGCSELHEQAGVLSYLAQAVVTAPPPEAAGSDAYAALAAEFEASVAALLAAVRSGEEMRIAEAARGLKPPYSRLFLKFG
ncbi:hypothetical protein [Mangrovicoccus sp. HB161399]|uniref:hypothetical protein n=1 Tax=Mangrovicoccus sp. HB161399 TaxID=2720392 RepID=UPI001551C098|nr:hypothetical protein [Mangrovicoccus sp. HB161399]